jgi:hypothetical protein
MFLAMRRWTAAVILVALLGGCSTYKTSRRVAIGGAVMTVVGAVALVVGARSEDTAVSIVAVSVAIPNLLWGVIFGVAGIAGMSMHPAPEKQAPQEPAQEPARNAAKALPEPRRERAWSLTKLAAEAARAGDCDAVSVRDSEVYELDAEFHATVFARDAAIKGCLDAARAPAPVASPVVGP